MKSFTTIVLILSALIAKAQTVPDTNFVAIPANPTFTFTKDNVNNGVGESSPIVNAYCIGKYAITNEQYYAFTSATNRAVPTYWTGGIYPTGKEKHPVLYVSYLDAVAYCNWLAATHTGWSFRLPTSAEWENAAKGPNNYEYPWGNADGTTYSGTTLNSKFCYNGVCAAYYLANYPTALATYNNSNSSSYGQQNAINTIISINSTGSVTNWVNHTSYTGFIYTDTFTVINNRGGFTANVYNYPTGVSSYGVYGLAGNAWTWTSTLDTASNGAEAGQYVNVIRGGSWYATKPSCKTWYRGEGRTESGKYNSVGFRVAAVSMTVLPLRLINFKGQIINGKNKLSWETASEMNMDKYIVERSANAVIFTAIGEISSIVNSTSNLYNFTDDYTQNNKYYRLKMVDKDGTATYSQIIALTGNSNSDIKMYQQQGYISFSGLSENNNYSLAIYNATGQIIQSKKSTKNDEKIVISTLSTSMYIVVLYDEGKEVFVQKVIQ